MTAQGGAVLAAPHGSGHDPAMTDMLTSRPEFLTVKELAELLRIKERKVYDLAASGQVPCSRATGKLLFPAGEIRAWIDENRTGPGGRPERPAVFLGSHEPLLDWALRESRSGLATIFDSSLDGLARFAAGEGVAAGLHVREPGGWNADAAVRAAGDLDAVLIRWARRRRGLVIRPDMAGKIGGLADLAGVRVAPRQSEAGAELMFRELLDEAGVAQDDITRIAPSRSEQDAVLAVAQGEADAAFGLEALAQPYGLAFVPVIEEEFDILADRRAWFEPPMQALLAFTRSEAFRDRAVRMRGYDTALLGDVKWNA